MAARPPNTGATGSRTVVRLSEVPHPHRLLVANRMIRVEGLVGIAALDLLLAAEAPTQDPSIEADTALVRKVCGR